jgi:hypothetical protein
MLRLESPRGMKTLQAIVRRLLVYECILDGLELADRCSHEGDLDAERQLDFKLGPWR